MNDLSVKKDYEASNKNWLLISLLLSGYLLFTYLESADFLKYTTLLTDIQYCMLITLAD